MFFVSASKYKAKELDCLIAETKYRTLLNQWNEMTRLINKKGGQDFLKNGVLEPKPVFNQDDIKKLLMLCHPDKHGGKKMAEDMTAKLLLLRE